MTENLQELLAGLDESQLSQVYSEFVNVVRRVRSGGAPPQGGDLAALVNAKAAEVLALSGAELNDDDLAAIRRAGAEQADPGEYLDTVQRVASGAKRRAKQQKLLAEYRAEVERTQARGTALLLLRQKYRKMGLDI